MNKGSMSPMQSSGQESYKQVVVNGTIYDIAVRHRNADSDNLIFFIHGLGCSKDSFVEAWASPLLASFSLLTFDLPGFGMSIKPSQFSYRMEEQALICHALLKQFAATRVHFVAHSMGGAIGLLLTQNFKPASFINVEGNLIAADCGIISRDVQQLSELDFVEHGFAALTQSLARYPNNTFDLVNAKPEAFHRSAISLVEWSDSGSLLDLFLKLAVPKSYIFGEKNADLEVLQTIRNLVQAIKIPGSAHFPMVENSDGFNKALADFLNSVRLA
jgi:pimeloyl-ACP methyl ester carboxylesterase